MEVAAIAFRKSFHCASKITVYLIPGTNSGSDSYKLISCLVIQNTEKGGSQGS